MTTASPCSINCRLHTKFGKHIPCAYCRDKHMPSPALRRAELPEPIAPGVPSPAGTGPRRGRRQEFRPSEREARS